VAIGAGAEELGWREEWKDRGGARQDRFYINVKNPGCDRRRSGFSEFAKFSLNRGTVSKLLTFENSRRF
jgi:hypothetical protein